MKHGWLILLFHSCLPCSLPPTDRELAWTIRRLNLTLWVSPWRMPLCVMEAASLSSRKHPCWPTWRRLRITSLKHSASPTYLNAQPWTWSSLISPTPSRKDHAGGGEVTNIYTFHYTTLHRFHRLHKGNYLIVTKKKEVRFPVNKKSLIHMPKEKCWCMRPVSQHWNE